MSKTVDQRVVQMQFDNKQFKSGVADTIKQLTSLKSNLNMDGSTKSLKTLQSAGKSLNLSKVASNIQTISNRFTTLGVIGTTALTNITNKAVNAGEKLIKSLTIDPIKTGLAEYETKINAITTILTNTKSKGTTLDEVNSALAELNDYADLTIYNFAEMTRNIGTFTAAGVDLDTSVQSIKGIANLAAGSGSSAQQAATAMYQLSQALASGTVKLMDWNSVVNAGMGGELFQNALKDTASEMGIVVDASIPFRESLQEGWLTADVLTTTLTKFTDTTTEMGQSLTDAATKVKTVTQLFSVLEETMQSGWSVSWENIIGDKADAEALLTAIADKFSEMTAPGADARNAALTFWEAFGGREDVVLGMANLVRVFLELTKPIKEAMLAMFGPVNGRRLKSISLGFRTLAESLKVSDEASAAIKSTFKAVFAIFKIGVLAVKSIVTGFKQLIENLKVLDIDVFGTIKTMGDFVVSLYEAAEQSGIFTTIVARIVEVITLLIFKFRDLIEIVMEWYKGLDKDGAINSIIESFNALWAALSSSDKIQDIDFSKIIKWPDFKSNGIKDLLDSVAESMATFKKNVKDFFGGIDFEQLFEFLKRGAGAVAILAVLRVIYKVIHGTATIIEEFANVLGGLSNVLNAYAKSLKADAFMKVAIAIGILVASLVALTFVETDKLWTSVLVIGAILLELMAAMVIFDKLVTQTSAAQMVGLGLALGSMSLGILGLVASVKTLSEIPAAGLKQAIDTIGKMMIGLILVATALDKIKSDTILKKSLGLIAFAGAITILVGVVEEIGSMDAGVVEAGLMGMAKMMGLMALLLRFGGLSEISADAGIGILAIAAGIHVLTSAVKKLGTMPFEQLEQGMGALVAILAIIGIFVYAIGAGVPGGVGSLGKNLLAISAGLLIMAGAIFILGSLNPESLAGAILAMGGIFIILAGFILAIKSTPFAAGQLLVLSVSLVVLAGALAMLSLIPGAGIAKALLAIVGVFLILGGLAVLLTPVLPIMLGMAATLMIVSVAIGLFGLSLVVLAAGVAAMGAVILGITALDILVSNFGKLLGGFVDAIIDVTPKLAKQSIIMMKEWFKSIRDNMDEMADIGAEIIQKFMDGLSRNMPGIVDSALNLMFTFIETLIAAIINYGPRLIDAFNNLIWGLLDLIYYVFTGEKVSVKQKVIEFAESFYEGFLALPGKIKTFFDNLLKAILGEVGEWGSDMFKIGSDMISGVTDGLKDGWDNAINSIKNLGTSMVAGFREAIDSHSPSIDMWKAALDMVLGVVGGVDENAFMATDAMKDLGYEMNHTAEPWSDEFKEHARKITEETAAGIEEGTPEVVEAVATMGKTAFEKSKEWIDERKYYSELSMTQELDEWKKLQGKYKEGTEERKEADREVYRLKKDLTEKMTEIDTEYYDGIDTLRNQYWADVKELEAQYDQSVKDRAQAIYDAFGLFDSIEPPEVVQGSVLIQNLESQIAAIHEWRNNLRELTEKGVSDELMDELEAMGPTSVGQLSALNKLTKPELDKYVALWKTKHAEAKVQAVGELAGMKKDTTKQILELSEQSASDLDSLKTVWKTKLGELTGVNQEELIKLRGTWDSEIEQLKKDTLIDFEEIKDSIKNVEWSETGEAIVDGVVDGINQNRNELDKTTTNMADSVKKVAEDRLEIQSPSKVFTRIGAFTIQGFINGIRNNTKNVAKATGAIGDAALGSIKKTVSNLSNMINMDLNSDPVIRPVMDLSDIEAGAKRLNGMVSDQSISMTGSYTKASSIEAARLSASGPNGLDTLADLLPKIASKMGESNDVPSFTFHVNGNLDETTAKNVVNMVTKEIKNTLRLKGAW